MPQLLEAIGVAIHVMRYVVFGVAVLAAGAALLDRAVRRRRINPFGRLGRFSRRAIDPVLAPFERRLLLSGRAADAAGWWLVGAAVVGGLVLLALLNFLRDVVLEAAVASTRGVSGLLVLAIGWAFSIVQIALLVRVVSSWFRVNPYSRPMRLVHALTDWILRPIRQLVPPIGGMIDLSPLIAYFLLSLLRGVVVGALR